MYKAQFPIDYTPLMDQKHTEKAIKFVKDTFERELSGELYLSRVTSPLFSSHEHGQRNYGNCPLTGEMETHGPRRLRIYAKYRTLYRHERNQAR